MSTHGHKHCANPLVAGKCGNHIDGLVQERRNSIALAMELRISYTNQLIYHFQKRFIVDCKSITPGNILALDPEEFISSVSALCNVMAIPYFFYLPRLEQNGSDTCVFDNMRNYKERNISNKISLFKLTFAPLFHQLSINTHFKIPILYVRQIQLFGSTDWDSI